ncbi:MAG: hypothetical protein AAF573_20570 [Bacteroidota bacterium]
MDNFSKLVLGLHVAAGFSSIVVFWIPIFLKKGSKLHNKIGKIYMVLMWIVVISAAILSIKNIIIGRYIAAAFLGFLTLITANPLWYGIAILKNKRGISRSYQRKHMLFHGLIFTAGIFLFGYGIYLEGKNAGVLMLIFGSLGMLTGKDVYQMYTAPSSKSNWIKTHIEGMLTSGIAAYTAFAVFGGRTFFGAWFTGYLSVIPWVAPTVVGIVLIKYYKKSYLKKTKVTRAVI